MTVSTAQLASDAPPPPIGYFAATRGPWYGYLFALPVLLAYEALEFIFQPAWVNGADALLTRLLAQFGAQERAQALLVLLLVSGLACWYANRRIAQQPVPLRADWFAAMAAESLVYALLLGGLVIQIMHLVLSSWALQTGPDGGGFWYNLTMALGAGIYEELLFRVLLMGGLKLLLCRLGGVDHLLAWTIAALVSSVVFSLFHYVGPGGEPFEVMSFIFRFIAGGLLAGLYAARGFGITVWTHAIYDVIVLFSQA